MKKKCINLILLTFVFPLFIYGQSYSGEMNKMASSVKNNLGKYNVLVGANTMSINFDDGNGRSFTSSFPNVYGYYLGGNMYSIWSESGNSFWSGSTEFIFGKQKVNSPSSASLIPDSLSIYNFSQYSGYFFKAPFKAIYNTRIGKNASWGISAGAVLQVPMMLGKIAHDGITEDLKSVYGQYLTDYGWTVGVEFGFRAGFINIDYSKGISNMSEGGGGTSITDNGSISFSIGYRFETAQGKKDGEKIRNIKKSLTLK
ncbi:MAG: hypothetical protein PF517_22060 [Salinivirgaceae bacterium]|jgi:hypothetical protein|nr:hypothetical protein [Salinivirgaceae bacterium]